MITAQDVRHVIESADDFGHELRVRRVLRGHKEGRIRHGGTYIDPVTEKPRQYDLRWHVFHPAGFAVNLAVECKNVSTENPVVVSGLKRTSRESFHYIMESRIGGNFLAGNFPAYFDVASMGVVRRTLQPSEIYPADSFVGKSIIRIDRSETGKPPNTIIRYVGSKDQEIYDRWSQALASAKDLVFEARHYGGQYKLSHVFTVILPMVVLPNRALWCAEYDENGKLLDQPTEVDEGEFFVAREIEVPGEFAELPPTVFNFSHIHFFTINGFANFLLKVAGDVEWLNACFPEEAMRAARDERLS
jgi:hypothetical protein